MLFVIGYHAFPRQVRAGFVGVDIFFVISGYLITSLIVGELQSGRFRFAHFYARRIRRIFPALVTILVASFAAGWFILSPAEFTSLGANIVGGAAFSSNFVLLHETGYFDLAADQKPLLHLWSLGIEEQFYLVWPVLLVLAVRRRLSLAALVVAILVASFAFNVATIGPHPASAFYLPAARSWELAFGALLASADFEPESPLLRRAANIIGPLTRVVARWSMVPERLKVSPDDLRSAGGLLLIVITLASLSHNTAFPGWAALLPVIGATLLVSARNAWLNRRVLSSRPIVFIGLISYPLYLWHWPLLAFLRIIEVDAPNTMLRWGVILASFALASITYLAIERPIRFARASRGIPLLCIAMSLIGVLGLATLWTDGFPSRVPDLVRSLPDPTPNGYADWRYHVCFLDPDQDQTAFRPECYDTSRPEVVLWGDSNAASLYPGLKSLASSVPFGLTQLTASGCQPLLSYVQFNRLHCKEINDFAFARIAQMHPDIVLLNSRWDYDNSEFERTVAELKRVGIKRIVVLGPLPRWKGRGLPADVLDYYYKDAAHELIPERTKYRSYGADLDAQTRAMSLAAGVEYISAWDVFCNSDGCLTRIGDDKRELTALDDTHLSVAGSIFFANAIKSRLLPDLPSADPAK